MMPLFIHTYGRVHNQITLKSIPKKLRTSFYIVIQAREQKQWMRSGCDKEDLLILPRHIETLSPTRQWLLEYAVKKGFDKICMLDDDLKFSYRYQSFGMKPSLSMKPAGPKQVIELFKELEWLLENYVHAGVSAREINRFQSKRLIECVHMARLVGYRPKEVLEAGCRFDRFPIMQDSDLNLQLLTRGFKNAVTFKYAHQQPGAQSEGGCSTYRTPDLIRKELQRFQETWRPFIIKTKGTKPISKMTDEEIAKFRWQKIAWKRAYESSKSNPLLRRER